MALPNPAHFLPRPYAVGADLSHLEHSRPAYQSLQIALSKAARAEGNIASPMDSGPRGNPGILKRLKLKTAAPKLKIEGSKLGPLRNRVH